MEFSTASAVPGAGVEADSDALSLTSGAFSVRLPPSAGAGDEATEADDCSSDFIAGFWKRRSDFVDNLRITTLD